MWVTLPVTISCDPKACIRKFEFPYAFPRILLLAARLHLSVVVGLIVNETTCHAWASWGSCTVYRQPKSTGCCITFFTGSTRLQNFLKTTARVTMRRSRKRTRACLWHPLKYSPGTPFLITCPSDRGAWDKTVQWIKLGHINKLNRRYLFFL